MQEFQSKDSRSSIKIPNTVKAIISVARLPVAYLFIWSTRRSNQIQCKPFAIFPIITINGAGHPELSELYLF